MFDAWGMDGPQQQKLWVAEVLAAAEPNIQMGLEHRATFWHSACCGFVEIDEVSLQVQDYPTQPPEAECSLGVFVMFRIVWVQLLTIFHNEMIFLLQI